MSNAGNSMQAGHVIAVIGPPAAGKTTVARLLCALLDGKFFNPDELAQQGRRDGWLTPSTAAAADTESERDFDQRALLLVTTALCQGALRPAGALTVLDDLVVTAETLNALAASDPQRRDWLHVIELDAADLVLLQRTVDWFCPVCRPDPDGGPYQPAPTDSQRPAVCDSCGRPLMTRSIDQPQTFLQRLIRYRNDQRPALRAAATDHHVKWLRIDAARPPGQLAQIASDRLAMAVPRHGLPKSPPTQRQPSP